MGYTSVLSNSNSNLIHYWGICGKFTTFV